MFKNNGLRLDYARKWSALLVGAALTLTALSARAEVVTFGAILSPGNEVPAIASPSSGSGQGFFVLDTDTNLFTWSVAFENLTGASVGAHIHAQASGTEPGTSNGPVIINFDTDPGVAVSGIGAASGAFLGSTTLSDDAASSIFVGGLLSDLWYVNIHTELNPPGEIRGQLLPGGVTVVPLPAAAWLLIPALGLLGLRARRRV